MFKKTITSLLFLLISTSNPLAQELQGKFADWSVFIADFSPEKTIAGFHLRLVMPCTDGALLSEILLLNLFQNKDLILGVNYDPIEILAFRIVY